MTDEEFIAEAERLHKSEAVARILDAIEDNYAKAWLATNLDQKDHREHLFRMVQCIRAFRGSLETIATDSRVIEFNSRLAAKQSVR
jgi:hypothetical protein